MSNYEERTPSGTQITVNKKGGCHAIHTAVGIEIEGVLCHTLEMIQSENDQRVGVVKVKMEMYVYEKDLKSTGKFNPADFIRKAQR